MRASAWCPLENHTGLTDCRRDIADPAHDSVAAQHAGQKRVLLDPVLEGDCGPPGFSSVRAASAAASVSHSLTAIMTMSARGTLAGSSVASTEVSQIEVPARALDPQPTTADRLQMRASCDESHVVPGTRQSRSKIPAEAAGPHHPRCACPPAWLFLYVKATGVTCGTGRLAGTEGPLFAPKSRSNVRPVP